MHAIAQWVSTLSEQGIKLSLDNGALKFSAPKGVITNDIKSQLKERKADILKFLETLGVSQPHESEDKKIAGYDHRKGCTLSWEQQRFWLLEQLADVSRGNNSSPESGFANNIVAAIKIDGDFDIEVLQSSVDTIVARHSVLRTNFSVEQGEVVQIVHPHRHIPILLEDYSQLGEAEALARAKTKLAEESKHRYQLLSDSLLRFSLVVLGERSCTLIINLHHIIADGWSFSILIQELAECYKAYKENTQPMLPPLAIQYVDYCDWQRHASNNLLERQRKYWLEKFQGELSPLCLPSEVSLTVPLKNTSVSELDGAVVKQLLSVETSRQLKNLAIQERTSLFTVTLAIFKLLFARLGNQEDIIIGTPVAGRNLNHTENLIGLFINTLALRTDFSGNPDFLQILARVRDVTLSAFENQDFSFEKIVEELNPPREKYRHPIFDVMFNFINTPDQHIQFSGTKVEPLEIVERHAPFQLALYLEEEYAHPNDAVTTGHQHSERQLVLRLLYKKAFYSAERMEMLLAQYHSLLIQVLANPARPINDYSLVTECTRRLPDPQAVLDYPVTGSVLAMFRQQCLRSGTAIACRYYGAGGELHSISYQQLYNLAAELSTRLQERGLRNGDVIAVSGIQGYATIVAVLGVLMSGGVFLALDDALPDARKTEILQQANARYLLMATSHQYLHYGQESCAFIPSGCEPIACQLNENNDGTSDKLHPVSFNDVVDGPAYIYFTSGSTGKPKGVLGTHKGLAHFVHWQAREFSINPEYRCAQLTNFSFDVFLRDMFLPLTTGATLCLPSRADILEPDNIMRWLVREEISLVHVVPSLCRSWLQNARDDYSLVALRNIFFAGEPLDASLIEHMRLNQLRDNSQAIIVNLYGPTETTLAKCFFRVPTPALPGIQPIGKPLPGSQLLILNAAGHLCGIGEIGEITIRTPFMSKGYVNNELLTNQSFIPRNDLTGTDERLYKTGDLGRYTHEGTIEIFGRKDRQVKIRGIRIELEEIRNQIKSHPDVVDAAVIVKSLIDSGSGSESQLIAYVVVKPNRSGQGDSMTGIRRYVKEKLPSYMVPAYLCAIDKLPLNKNGKLDINQLPVPTQENLDGLEYQAARTSTEEKLVHIWESLLNQTNIGIHDDFFTLGGHSIMAVRLMARLRDSFSKNFPIGMLFENSTIEKLAAAIDSNTEYHWRSLIKMNGDVGNKYLAQNSPAPKNLFCIPGGGGNIMYLYELCAALGSDINVYGLQAKGLDGKSAPHQTIEETAKHYINEIKSVQGTGPYHITGHSFGGKIAFEIANQLLQQGEAPGVLALLDSAAPQYISSDKEKINQWTQAQWIVHTASIVEQLCGVPADITCDDLDPLDDHQQLHVFNRYLQRVGWIPDAADTSYLVGQINILKANSQTEYSPQYKLASHITYFRATQPMPGIDTATHASANPAAEWQCHSEKPIDYIAVPGNHLTMLSKPNVEVLAQHIHKLILNDEVTS